jgi:hypothetical protein
MPLIMPKQRERCLHNKVVIIAQDKCIVTKYIFSQYCRIVLIDEDNEFLNMGVNVIDLALDS